MIRYLTSEEVLIIHARIVDATGGLHGVRDISRIASMIERPKQQFGGEDLYPTLFLKSAVYFEVSAYHHPFVDGNKRTAIALGARFLFLNGYDLATTDENLEEFVIECVIKKNDLQVIAKWFEKHSRKILRRKKS
ncbi:MAG: type II toxin-antitoxin system death-on-curing family toxin [Candidatus Taylorbacteria bacterium]